MSMVIFFNFYLFLERGEGSEKKRESNINVLLPLVHPLPGTWPVTQACALTGNQTGYPLVCRLALSPLSHTSQGISVEFSVKLFHSYIMFFLILQMRNNLKLKSYKS